MRGPIWADAGPATASAAAAASAIRRAPCRATFELQVNRVRIVRSLLMRAAACCSVLQLMRLLAETRQTQGKGVQLRDLCDHERGRRQGRHEIVAVEGGCREERMQHLARGPELRQVGSAGRIDVKRHTDLPALEQLLEVLRAQPGVLPDARGV